MSRTARVNAKVVENMRMRMGVRGETRVGRS